MLWVRHPSPRVLREVQDTCLPWTGDGDQSSSVIPRNLRVQFSGAVTAEVRDSIGLMAQALYLCMLPRNLMNTFLLEGIGRCFQIRSTVYIVLHYIKMP